MNKSLVALGVTEERQEVTFCSWVLRITVELVAHSTVMFCSWVLRITVELVSHSTKNVKNFEKNIT